MTRAGLGAPRQLRNGARHFSRRNSKGDHHKERRQPSKSFGVLAKAEGRSFGSTEQLLERIKRNGHIEEGGKKSNAKSQRSSRGRS
jgi:hypothetical protein